MEDVCAEFGFKAEKGLIVKSPRKIKNHSICKGEKNEEGNNIRFGFAFSVLLKDNGRPAGIPHNEFIWGSSRQLLRGRLAKYQDSSYIYIFT